MVSFKPKVGQKYKTFLLYEIKKKCSGPPDVSLVVGEALSADSPK